MKLMKRAVVAAAALAFTASAAGAIEADVMKLRTGVMEQNNSAVRILAQMAQGKADFSAEIAIAALSQIGNTAEIFPALFPDGTEGQKASANIFSDQGSFHRRFSEDEDRRGRRHCRRGG